MILFSKQAPLGRYLNRLVGDPELARDLLQDTLLSAYHAFAATQPTQPRAWLYRIAINHALGHFRRRKLIAWIPLSRLPLGTRPPSVASHADQVTVDTALADALAKLDPRERACLLLDAAGFPVPSWPSNWAARSPQHGCASRAPAPHCGGTTREKRNEGSGND